MGTQKQIIPELIALGAALAVVACVPSAAAQCMQARSTGEFVEGMLTRHVFRDAAGRPERAFIVTLPVPECLQGDDETDNVASATTVHLVPVDDAVNKQIARFVGQTVLARGMVFGAITVHHHAPIVMTVEEIDVH